MDAAGWWEVEVPTPLGRLRFDVHLHEDGSVTAGWRGRPITVPTMRVTPEGDGQRVAWTQRLPAPLHMDVAVDALVVGDRLTGTAQPGVGLPPVRLEGRRVA